MKKLLPAFLAVLLIILPACAGTGTEASEPPPDEIVVSKETGEETGGDTDLYVWPVEGGRFNGTVGSYRGHDGMDITAEKGTNIRAARGGTVTYASNDVVWPDGRSIVIDHGDGSITRYAHCDAVAVSQEDYVEQGAVIGQVGRTGNATDNHLHFEIYVDDVVQDPVEYIGTAYPGIWDEE